MKRWYHFVIVFALILGALYYLEQDVAKEQADDAQQERASKLFEASFLDGVHTIGVATGKVSVTLERHDPATIDPLSPSPWRLTQPFNVEADGNAIETYLTGLKSLRSDMDISDNATDLAVFGLDEANKPFRLVLTGKEGAAKTLLIGNENPDKTGRYTALAGSQRVVLASSEAANWRDQDLAFFRKKTLFEFSNSQATTLRSKWKGQQEFVIKQDNGLWSLEKPFAASLDQSEVSSLINQLKAVRILKFVNEEASKAGRKEGLKPPQGVIEVTLQLGTEGEDSKPNEVALVLEIGNETEEKDGYFARKKGTKTLYTLQKFSTEQLKKPHVDMIESRIADAFPKPLRTVIIERPSLSRWTLSMIDPDTQHSWTLHEVAKSGDKPLRINHEKAKLFANLIRNFRPSKFAARTLEELKPRPLQALSLTLGGDADKEATIVFYKSKSKTMGGTTTELAYYVQGGPHKYFYTVDKSDYDRIKDHIESLVHKETEEKKEGAEHDGAK